jgi:hypothetical protein
VRYLRSQNALIQSRELFKELDQLPTYDSLNNQEAKARTKHLQEQSAALFKEVASYSSRSKVIDLSLIQPGKAWTPSERKPSAQLAAKRATLEKLKAKVDKLTEENRAAGTSRALPAIVKI